MQRRKRLLLGLVWVMSLGLAYWIGAMGREDADAGRVSADGHERLDLSDRSFSEVGPLATGLNVGQAVAARTEGGGLPALLLESRVERVLAGEVGSRDLELAELEIAQRGIDAAWSSMLAASGLPPGDRGRSELLRAALERIAEEDPLMAMDEVGRLGTAREIERARRGILEVWGARDPVAAMNWVEANQSEIPARLYRERVESVIEAQASVDPEGALSAALTMGASGGVDRRFQEELLEEAVEGAVEAGAIEVGWATILAMEPGDLRQDGLHQFLRTLAEVDPVRASLYWENLDETTDPKGPAAAALVAGWADQDPGAAAGFVAALDLEDPANGRVLATLIERWTRYEIEAPGLFLNQLPTGEATDRAIGIFAMRAAEEDPAAALSWAESIGDEGMRSRSLRRIASVFREQDPQGFETWLTGSGLSESEQAAMRQSGGGGGWWRGR